MLLTFAYRRPSTIVDRMTSLVVALSPNLRRERVSYNGALLQPLRFWEAICALHDIVISDLRFKKRDKSAYEAYKVEQKKREDAIRRAVSKEVRTQALAQQVETILEGLGTAFSRAAAGLLECPPELRQLSRQPRSGVVAALDAVRSGHHRGRRRAFLRVCGRRSAPGCWSNTALCKAGRWFEQFTIGVTCRSAAGALFDPLNFLAPFGAEVQKSLTHRSSLPNAKALFIFGNACRELGEL